MRNVVIGGIAAFVLPLLRLGFCDPETDDLIAGAFGDAFDEEGRRIFYELLEVFANVSQRSSITYTLFAGSLFGQYCIGDQLAWDDDVYLIVYDGWEKLEHHLFDMYKGKYRLTKDTSRKWNRKLYSVEGKPKIGRPDMQWTAPFLDIFHMNCTKSVCHHPATINEDNTTYNRGDIFPLRNASFGKLKLPIPHRPAEVLYAHYKLHPCKTALPAGWDHFLEEPRPRAVIKRFQRHGIPFKRVARRLSDSVCTQSYLSELPNISLNRRSLYATQWNVSAAVLNRDICKELRSIEVDNGIAHPGASNLAAQDIKVVFYNMEGGNHWEEAFDRLGDAHVIMLTEVDVGSARTGNVNVARELAHKLGKNYVQAIEFVDLSQIHANNKGLRCHAILSDFPLNNATIVRLPIQSKTGRHLGSRALLQANVMVGGQPIWIAVTNLDGKNEEFDASVKAVYSIPGPMIYAGNLSASITDAQRRFNATGLRFVAPFITPAFGQVRATGEVISKVTQDKRMQTHLVGARGVNISDLKIGHDGESPNPRPVLTFRVEASSSHTKRAIIRHVSRSP